MYDTAMKFVLLAIFVLIATQPLPVSSCEMSAGQGTDTNMHGDMHDDDMNGMDCCDDPEEPGDGCSSMSHCGACAASLVAISPASFSTGFMPGVRPHLPVSSAPLDKFSSPPFRPPIT